MTLLQKKTLVGLFSLISLFLTVSLVSAQVPPKEILIGGTISLTGRFATIVGPFQKFLDNYASLVNERGGVSVKEFNKKLPIRFIIYDDKSDQATSQ